MGTTGGQDQETDDALRLRAKHALEVAGRATSNALKYAILAIPGIRDVVILDMNRGIGTVDAMVVGTTYPINSTILTQSNDTLQEYKAAGVDGQIIQPVTVFIDVAVTATLNVGPGYDEAIVTNNVKAAITNYINGLTVGADVIKNQIIATIMGVTGVVDATLTSPTTNINILPTQIAQAGAITMTVTKHFDRGVNLNID
jgi:uncharacterized phage protein gp47/JayE